MLSPQLQLWCKDIAPQYAPVTLYFVDNLGSNISTNSAQLHHRQTLRQLLKSQLSLHGFKDTTSVLNLEKRPTHPQLSLSLSHSLSASLIGWTPLPFLIGVDIEATDRLSPAVIQRISSPAELKDAPDSRFVWCAKEAAFKALSPSWPVISDISITSWEKRDATTWKFRVRIPKSDKTIDGEGLVRFEVKHILCFFICKH